MKRSLLVTFILVAIAVAAFKLARHGSDSVDAKPSHRFPSTATDARIRNAETIISISPSKAEGYNLLASAYLQKARETGDSAFNIRAEQSLDRSFELSPENLDALNLKASLLVSYHRFSEALDFARRAERIRPDNPDVYVAMTDALVELGQYQAAIASAQKLMDIRPDSLSYARASHLRALHGDTQGAIEAMSVALRAADPQRAESAAWCRVHLANQMINAGMVEEAEKQIDAALRVFPDYHLSLAAKGRVRALREDANGAIDYFLKAQARVPDFLSAVALGDLYSRLGRNEEARREYELAEAAEQTVAPSPQLALLWAERGERLDEAVEVMRKERAARSDIYTCDALAWALFRSGDIAEARRAIDEALRLKTRDARIHYHAGVIYNAVGKRRRALEHLRLALEAKSSFDGSNAAFGPIQMENARRMIQDG
jgi:tetratricopeptide (TPR) repeat protein